ncbi:transcription elongation factor A protein 2 isoform X4 [Microcebus murinus]|uniref:transcription elongation factor A protein 2 isoform X4 n=1 Tax=Microcebus murinus TaxID=30608 RepID=UPI003F6BDA0A
MQRAAAGAGGLGRGSAARGGAESAAAGAGGGCGRGRVPGRAAEAGAAGAAGAGAAVPEAMMGKEEEIARIARRLDKMVTKKSAEGAMDLLRELKAMPVTLHLLQSTRVGMSVNALRKQSSDEEVIALAKSLIKSWKKLLDASDAKARERGRGTPLPTSSSKDASEATDPRVSPRTKGARLPSHRACAVWTPQTGAQSGLCCCGGWVLRDRLWSRARFALDWPGWGWAWVGQAERWTHGVAVQPQRICTPA